MLTISNVSNSEAASNYYEAADDYYSRDRSPSIWSGQAATMLGLVGAVESNQFRALLDGQLPTGDRIHAVANGHRGGTDLTFSAPKSVSLQALLGGDSRLLVAHETAVARALEYAESIAASRFTQQGVTTRVATGNLAIAQFRHDLSRAADPQLHTHCVVLNLTRRPDGVWRAVDNEPFYRHKMLLGAYYRSELAKEVQALGYEVRVTHHDGRFELAHMTPRQIAEFSQRSLAIDTALAKQGLTRESASARKLQTLALQTRQHKTDIDRSILRAEWGSRAHSVGLDLTASHNTAFLDLAQYAHHATKAVAYASHHLMEREAVIREIDLFRVAVERGVGLTDFAAIRTAATEAVERGELIRQGDRYTTPLAQSKEREILAIEATGRGQVSPIMDRMSVDQALALTALNNGQREAVCQILSANSRVTGLQGIAGTGKTTTLRAMRALAESRGIRLVGLAPSAGAARELAGSGINAGTLAALRARGFAGLTDKTMVVLDEAGMVAVHDMHSLFGAAERARARVLLVGDIHQLKAIEAGRPFSQLQAAGMVTARLNEIQRQRDPVLKEAVELAAAGQVHASIAKLETRIVEVAYHRQRHAQIAADYSALDPDMRERSLIVSSTNNSRQAINAAVRDALGLAGEGQIFTTLARKDLTEAQALRTVSYQPGDVVRAERPYSTLGMNRGDLARVVEGPAGSVTLERADGVRVSWRPTSQPHMRAYAEHTHELAIGDRVRFTENDYRCGVANGDIAKVVGWDTKTQRLSLEKSDGTKLVLDTSKLMYLEHGYCQTVHSSQGQTVERVLIDAEASNAMANESLYYVAISRARSEVAIYTDDKTMLPEVMGRENTKAAALDLDLTLE